MKDLIITPRGPGAAGKVVAVDISQKEEKWKLFINTGASRELELSRITFDLHNGSTWSGNVQDFAAIQAYSMNALDFIGKYMARDIAESEIGVECVKELEQLLSHFSKTA